MKIVTTIMAVMILCASVAAAAMEIIEAPKSCQICRMDRTMFAQSRMLVIYTDGVTVGVCSIHCAAEELMNHGKKQVKELLVADYSTKKLIDAKSAVWVVGGKKKGVMTSLAKWAFAREKEALRFVTKNGGAVKSFEQVINSATREVMDQAAEEQAAESEILRK